MRGPGRAAPVIRIALSCPFCSTIRRRGLEEGYGVGVSGGLGLGLGLDGEAVGLLHGEDLGAGGLAQALLGLGEGEGLQGGALGGGGGAQVFGVDLDGVQRVGDVLEGLEHGGAVLGAGLGVLGLGLALLGEQLPPSKMGWANPPARVQNWLPLVRIDPRLVDAPPPLALSVMDGRRAATATPTSALAACRLASAARTSGRWSTSFDGRLTGSVSGRVRSARWRGLAVNSAGVRPVSTASWS